MPVQIEELSIGPAAPESRGAAEAPASQSSVDALRRELRALNYSEGAARLSTRSGASGDTLPAAAAGPATANPSTQLGSSGATVTADGGTVSIDAGVVNVNAGMTRVNGVLQTDTLISNTVVGSTYTPGAGNLL